MADSESASIEGISIGGYRSFGTVQRIAPLSKINVFIGPNNCGKSNVLRFIHSHLGSLMGEGRDTKPYEKLRREIDGNLGTVQHPLTAGTGLSRDAPRLQAVRTQTRNRRVIELFDELLQLPEFSFDTSLIWHERFSSDLGRTPKVQSADEDTRKRLLVRFKDRHSEIHDLWKLVKPGYSGGSLEGWFSDIVGFVLEFSRQLPQTILIPAVRQITTEKSDSKSWCGAGIVDHLAQLQNPDHHQQEKKTLFRAIESLLQEVTGNELATLEIPYERKSIIVHMDNKHLPLESLGTGIHELIILAAACTSLQELSVCIEEPELHLNPLLQRKFLRYLFDKTNNQYFLTSHLSALLDTEIATIFQVTHDGMESRVQLASAAGQRWQICRDLGYKASDLMQSNAVIWVEGPSDRIYLNHWIRSLADDLVENTHYSIMFYGGRLLCHLSAGDREIDDFISLCHLNRNPAILVDSDKANEEDGINDTKTRILDEFKNIECFAWLTAGREIENYISESLFRSTLNAISDGASKGRHYGPYDKLLPKDFDKLSFARKIAEQNADLDVLDLREKATALVDYIRAANE